MAQYFYDLSICNYFTKKIAAMSYGGSLSQSALILGGGISNNGARAFTMQGQEYTGSAASGYFAPVSFSNGEVLIKCSVITRENEQNLFNIGPGIYVRAGISGGVISAYQISWGAGSTYRSLRIYDSTNTSSNLAASSTSYLPTKSDPALVRSSLYIRVNVNGTTIRARAWFDGDAEPATWGVTATDSKYAGPGLAGIQLQQTRDGRVYEFISIGTDGDSAPMSYPGGNRTVAGVVKKPNGDDAVGYQVRCYHRDTGFLLAETISAALGSFEFSLPIPSSEPVYCVAIDQLGNEWNAPIRDLIQPSSVSNVNYSVYGAMAVPIAYDGTRFVFSCAVDKLSTSENYRAVAYAAAGDSSLTLSRDSRLPFSAASESFSAVINGSNITLCQASQFSRATLSSLSNSKLTDWSTNSYSSFPVAGVGGGFQFAKLAYDGSAVFTFDIGNAGIVFKAADGITFSEPSTIAGTGMRARCCAFVGSNYVIGGQIYKRSAGQVDLMTSTDLLSFTAHTFGFDLSSVAEGETAGAVLDIAGFSSYLFAIVNVTAGPDIGYNIMRSSDNGVTWVKANPSGWSTSDSWISFAAYGSDLLILGKGKTARTSDGAAWVTTALTDPDVTLDRPIVGGSTVMCRGRKTEDSPVDPGFQYLRFTAWKSTDGSTFTQLAE